jgi:hypothetical protein
VLVVAATWFTDLKSKAARPPSFSGVRILAPQLAKKGISFESSSQSSSGSLKRLNAPRIVETTGTKVII